MTNAACDVFLSALDDTSDKVVLDFESSFVDNCDEELMRDIGMDADLTFYSDAAFSVKVNRSDPFVIGRDTIYGKLTFEWNGTVQVNSTSIDSVLACTAPNDANITFKSGGEGCLSENIDADRLYPVIGFPAINPYDGKTYEMDNNNEAAFSFLAFGAFLFLFMICPSFTDKARFDIGH